MAVALVRSAVDGAQVRRWLAGIDAHPAWQCEGSPGPDFNPYCSSLRAAAIESLPLVEIAATLAAGEVGVLSRARVGGDALACDLDQCWVRRQYAPGQSPPGHAPHSWHQDGALGFDFLGAASRDARLLAMATCWIALTPCGADAPGLELVDADSTDLLPLPALADTAIRAGHPAHAFLCPALDPGDALVFGGGVLHHTHVGATMTRDRTSLELRFFPAGRIPARLRGDRFLPLH